MSDFDPTKEWTGYVPRNSVAADPEQPRTEFDHEALQRLGASMRRKQQVPCLVIPCRMADHPQVRWQLIDGERRWRAAEMAGIELLWVAYDPKIYGEANDEGLRVPSGDDLHAASLTANFCREGHTKMEISNAVQRQLKAGASASTIAAMVGKSERWVEQYRSMQDLHPHLQRLLDVKGKERKLAFTVALELVKHPCDRQLSLWERFKHLNPNEAQHRVRITNVAMADRTAAGNKRYIAGRVLQARTALRQCNDVGEVMMRALTPAKALELTGLLADVRSLAKSFEARLEKRSEEKEDDAS